MSKSFVVRVAAVCAAVVPGALAAGPAVAAGDANEVACVASPQPSTSAPSVPPTSPPASTTAAPSSPPPISSTAIPRTPPHSLAPSASSATVLTIPVARAEAITEPATSASPSPESPRPATAKPRGLLPLMVRHPRRRLPFLVVVLLVAVIPAALVVARRIGSASSR